MRHGVLIRMMFVSIVVLNDNRREHSAVGDRCSTYAFRVLSGRKVEGKD
jgi:hypothetical protein